MRSIFLFTYRMRAGGLSSMPVYAASLPEATGSFHRAMAGHGCEHEQYSIIRHRQIRESEIKWYLKNHHLLVDRLSPDDRTEFFEDRQARQIRELGWADETTTQFFNHEMEHVR